MENKSKGRVARAYRISDETVETLKAIADKENCTETAVIENAIRYYKDYLYMQTDGAFINESVKRTFLASVNLMETRLNNRTNKVLSELAIQQAIICQVLAHELEINPRALDNYRRAAVAIGSEGRGLSEELLALCDKTVRIPMSARCESLNAAAAATVLLWEMYR